MDNKSAKAVDGMLGCTGKSIPNRCSEVILPLYSALVRPHMEHSVQVWAPQYKKDTGVLENTPIKDLKDDQGSGFSLEKIQKNLISVYKNPISG